MKLLVQEDVTVTLTQVAEAAAEATTFCLGTVGSL